MAQLTFSVRMDEALKKEFDALCHELGLNASTAINIFARAVVREGRIPFEISLFGSERSRARALNAFNTLRDQASANGAGNMTLNEINAEISESRSES
ncbi:MAG: type II toxin-antitoxin system RelB/DinJ family antitoxin [Clostridia bacterium]|nr:type II toxin-antitoxin system RelB/DinJ family antitoxin [Clostridia bacterium]